jgi:hypothetical protein
MVGIEDNSGELIKEDRFCLLEVNPLMFLLVDSVLFCVPGENDIFICTIYVHLEEKSIGKTAEFQLHKRYFSRDNEEEKTSNMHFNLTAPFVTLIARSLVQSTRQSLRERACRLSGALCGPFGQKKGKNLIELKGKLHKTFLLDTNIVISCLKDREIFGSNLLNRILPEGVFVFSPVSLWELSLDKVVFDEFLKVFSLLPSILIRSREDLLQKESESYVSGSPTSITEVGIPFNSELFHFHGKSLRKIVDSYISEGSGTNYKKQEAETFLDIIRQKTIGFMTRDKYQENKTVKTSIELFAFQLIAETIPAFARTILDSKVPLDVHRFRSAVSMSAMYHYKFINPKRKGEFSDISDILISPSIPFVDCYITENGVATSIRELKSRFGLFPSVDVLVTRDIIGK